jgi:hypothetical protein
MILKYVIEATATSKVDVKFSKISGISYQHPEADSFENDRAKF